MTPTALRKLRGRLGLTQSKFAALLGVHPITLAKWEGGTRGMSATTKRLLRVLAERGVRALARSTPRTARRGRARRRS